MLTRLKFLTQHPLTRQRPLAAIGRYLRWQIESRLHNEVRFEWVGGSRLIVRNGMTGATGNIYCGLHEFPDMAFVIHALRPGDLFVDVGANIGSYTVLATAVAGARVVAIEPDPTTADHLCRNISENHLENQVQVHRVAVGADEGEVSFTVGLDTMNQVVRSPSGRTRQVQVRRLDDILTGQYPSLIKLDVEGFEAEALAGAESVLAGPSLLAVQTESCSAAVLAILKRHGFEQTFYDPFKRSLIESPAYPHSNGLFVKNRSIVADRIARAVAIAVVGHAV